MKLAHAMTRIKRRILRERRLERLDRAHFLVPTWKLIGGVLVLGVILGLVGMAGGFD